MKRIGILGTGWLGLPLAKHLRSKNYIVSGTTTKIENFAKIHDQVPIQLYELNFEQPIDHLLIEKFKLMDVLILAIPASRVIANLAHVIAFIRDLKATTEVIFCSSTGVYPDHLTQVDETYIFQENDFENRNVQLELAIQQLPQRVTILRLAGLIGPKRHPITMLSKKGSINGAEAPINLIHLYDVVHIIGELIAQENYGGIFNICSNEHPTKGEYYTQAANYYQLTPPILEKANSGTKMIDGSKITQQIGYNYTHSIFDFEQIPI